MPKAEYRDTYYAINARERYKQKTIQASIFLNAEHTKKAIKKYKNKKNVRKAIKEIFLADLYQE